LVLLIAVALLVVHSFGMKRVLVDNTSLILLLIILASPFIAAIKKIKIGEFEAEIQPDEVKRVTEQAEDALPEHVRGDALPSDTGEAGAAILALAETDPVVALAKLRIELEGRLRRLHQRADPSGTTRSKPASLSQIVRQLASRDVFAKSFGSSLLDVIAICNRAIHGEDIRGVDARQIVDAGIDLLEVLERMLRTYGATRPVETAVISRQECDALRSARLQLTAVVPLVENPERRVYELTQDELDEYLDGYSEFAQFVIGIERIDSPQE
jgi:hypothetical protein